MGALLNLLLLIVGLAIVVVWIVSLWRWDGEKNCNPNECETCPFPCEGRSAKNNNGKETTP